MKCKLPVVVISPKDKKYKLSKDDFSLVRQLVAEARGSNLRDTESNLDTLLDSDLKFKSRKVFKLRIADLDVDTEDFRVTSTQGSLSEWDLHYMENLIKCAAIQINSILILPSYIQVARASESAAVKPTKKTSRKPSKRPKNKE
jgi:hypothetical protein